MADVETFHLLAVAKSLETQNQAIGVFIMKVSSVASLATHVEDIDALKSMVAELKTDSAALCKTLWGDEG